MKTLCTALGASLLLSLLPACGQQLVELAGPDAAQTARTDAGSVDAGNTHADAGNGDAADAHAGNGDAGGTDAGTPDAATSDAGAADVGTADVGALDAGTRDAGAIDVRAIDAGNLDAGASDTISTCRQAAVTLASAGNFAVLAGSTVTNTGLTSVTGDLGVSPGTAVTGFGPGVLFGTQHAGDPTAAQGQADLTIAYNDAAGRTLCPIAAAGNLGGQTLAPGLYKSTGSLEVSSGDLTLDAQGDPNAVFIFQMASTLTTTSGRQVILTGGAKSTNVFWQVGTSATLGSTSVFQGTVMANQAITLNTGATLNGRALARIAAVAMDTNVILTPTP